LKRAEEDRALMLAGVSHDLRTPLSRIRLGVEMLDGPDSSLKEGMVQDVEDIDSVIGQFLDFARVNSEELVMSKVDVNELVNGVIQRYSHQGKHVTARLRTLPPATMHAPAIQRVLTNLINNALRHGGDEVTVETAEDHRRARISVLDRGPGIPETEVERMLQPFTRLNSARSTTGSGLGLAIVDRIVKMHNGTIRLLPRADGGLEARVELPL
jgi:two-component system osmolarity sensor histidine kinase EnvZ